MAPPTRSGPSRCRPTDPVSTSTPPCSTRRGSCGSPASRGCTADSIRRPAKSRCSTIPRDAVPYGIATTPAGDIWYASLAGSHIAHVDPATRAATIVEPPTAGQGARRVWSDSQGRIWVSEWNSGKVAVHDPSTGAWEEWTLPGDGPQAYAVYVDERDIVWLTDFGANAIVRFDPATETFDAIELPSADAQVRQLLGRPGEVWGAESAVDKLVVVTGG